MRLTLERAILKRLKHHKHGCTVEELYENIREPIGVILAMLEQLSREGSVRMSDEGVWILIRDSSAIRKTA
jgi:DNA-binding IclR family transcriptional regulator